MPRRMIGDDIVSISPEGEIADRIELWRLLDPAKNRICPLERRWEWTHCNSLDVLPDGGIAFSARNTSTVGIVDAGGEGEEASLRWQWGWPEISHQHHATALPDGRILLYDNGMHRLQELCFSRVVEVNPATDELDWTYQAEPREQFFSAHISGAARLPNQNTLITEGASGRGVRGDARGRRGLGVDQPVHDAGAGDEFELDVPGVAVSDGSPGAAGAGSGSGGACGVQPPVRAGGVGAAHGRAMRSPRTGAMIRETPSGAGSAAVADRERAAIERRRAGFGGGGWR